MRALIRAPFDDKIISPKKTRHCNTIDNVKAKIDDVKAKIQEEERRSWSRPTLARRPVFGQLAASPTSFPLEEPRLDKSPPRMTSLCLAREVSASHERSGPDWCMGPDARHEHRHRRMWRNESLHHTGTTAGGHAGVLPRQEP
jgi:hypothetical protein